ncbi:MAG: ACP S-malonyltransferase [Candidatus Aminicenantes bacterium]|jgi:[acyl-carrier-protein] S-malonyltransferase
MKKMVFMFPGVGSQHLGMGQYFYDHFKIVRETFEEASDVLKLDVTHLCFSKTEEKKLSQLESSQAALLVVCVAFFRVYMQELGITPQYCLGHSLGEYSALCCAGVFDLKDALMVVKERGRILSEAASTMGGIMAWVINLDYQIVERVIKQGNAGQDGNSVFISAYDSPTQSSISGPRDAVLTIGRKLEKEGAIVYPLKLSGPFHSPLMVEAAEKIKSVLCQFTFRPLQFPVIANRNAAPYTEDMVVDNLSLQLSHPIRWRDSIKYLLDQGIETAVEIGPDRVLKHLMKNNTNTIRVFSFENGDHLVTLKKAII